jgi:hypothetical protein
MVHLLCSLEQALRFFGPEDRRYTRRARFCAIAALLIERGIESAPEGTPEAARDVVCRRLERRVDRAAR